MFTRKLAQAEARAGELDARVSRLTAERVEMRDRARVELEERDRRIGVLEKAVCELKQEVLQAEAAEVQVCLILTNSHVRRYDRRYP